MVAQIFTDITHFEVRVVWHDKTTGFVNGNRFSITDGDVEFTNHQTFNNPKAPKRTRELSLALAFAVRKTPEFTEAKRESKAVELIVQNGNFPGLFQVHNPLNGSLYNVVLHPNKTYCECPDHQYRGVECKHIKAVKAKQPKPQAVPTLMPSYAGKARSQGRIKAAPDLDISEAQYQESLNTARASLGI